MAKVLLIDICGTLYRSNTTFDMLKFYFGNRISFRMIQRLRKLRIIGFLNARIFSCFNVDVIRMLAIRNLKGYDQKIICAMTSRFYSEYLKSRTNFESIKVVNMYRKVDCRLIIVSATMDCIAECVAENNGIYEVLSSKLHYTNGICDGYLYNDLLGTKKLHIQELGLHEPYDIITDNYSDNDLIKEANKAYIIQYRNKKNKWGRYLSDNDLKKCEIIEIG